MKYEISYYDNYYKMWCTVEQFETLDEAYDYACHYLNHMVITSLVTGEILFEFEGGDILLPFDEEFFLK